MAANKINNLHSFTNDVKRKKEKNDDVKEKNENEKCCWCFDSSYKRFIALIFIAISSFFYSANYDMPASMESVVERTFSVVSYEFEYLYSVYSLPNVIMCFFGGLLIDKVFGLVWGSLLFGLIALAGQIIITVGGFTQSYCLMLVGRFVGGIGTESVSLSLCCFTVIWFKGKELSFVFGLMTSVLRLGSSFAFLIFTPLYNYIASMSSSIDFVYGTSIMIFLVLAVAMVIFLALLGYYSKKNGKFESQVKEFQDPIRFKEILEFPLIFWMLLIMLSICNNAFYSFVSISQPLLERKYNLTEENASYLSSVFNFISALACPFPGLIVDKFGKDLYFNFLGMGIGILSQTIMAFTNWSPLIPLILYAIFFAVFTTCSWPMVSRVVKPYQLATAYGTLICFFNLVGTFNNILVGYMLEVFDSNGVSVLLLCNIIVGGLFCLIILLLDRRSKGTLNLTAAKRRQRIEND